MDKDRFYDFNGLVNSAIKSMNKIKFKKMSEYGLGSAHTVCLLHIFANNTEGLTKTELASLCEVDKAHITRIVAYLTDNGFVNNFANDLVNVYRRRHTLTEKGIRAAMEIRDVIIRVNNFVSREISAEEIAIFYKTFNIICQNLKTVEEHC